MPGIPLPLHIFEERYKLMIGECLAEKREFGIVFFNATDIQSVGCTAGILKVIKRYDDGRLDIMTRGQRRFEIKEILDNKPYLRAHVEYFDDIGQEDDRDIHELAEKGLALLKQLASVLQSKEDLEFEDIEFSNEMDLKSVSFRIAGCQGFNPEEKQRFLEMRSTRERLEKSVASLEKIIERINITSQIHKIIGGNGNIRRWSGTR